MSAYRPWAPQVEEAETGEAVTAEDEEEVPYAPWAPDPVQQRPPGTFSAPPKEQRFEQPPGLGAVPQRRKGDNAHETAAAMLLWTGGFVLFASIALVAAMTIVIDIERITSDGGHDPDIPEMASVRGYGWLGVLASALFILPGVGLLYHQAWARPLGFVGASVALLLGPVGLILGIIALVSLGRMEGT